MRYQIYTSDNGKFFILDEFKGTILCYCGNKSLAETTAQKLNCSLDRSASPDLNSTKIH